MKLFILIAFILFVVIVPQLYTWVVRESTRYQEWYAFLGGVLLILAISALTIYMNFLGIILFII